MSLFYPAKFYRKAASSFIAAVFAFNIILPPSYAQVLSVPMGLTPGFQPATLKGLTLHPENPLLFDFIVDRGESPIQDPQLRSESEKLIKYFLASMTIPDKDAWVNLSPNEKNRIIPDALGQTEMGRVMLEQDFILKQLSASLTNPNTELGRKYWDEVNRRTISERPLTPSFVKEGEGGVVSSNVESSTSNVFTKVWITPDSATVVEKDGFAYISESKLKVMMEEDYLAGSGERKAESDDVSTEIFREMILPKLIEEVNTGKTFAATRQVYQSVILATWYKKTLKDSLLGRIYADKSKTAGIETDEKNIKQEIYEQYLETFKKGVYNIIKEEESGDEVIPRKYFSGGQVMNLASTPLKVDRSASGVTEALTTIQDSGERMVLVSSSAAETKQEVAAQVDKISASSAVKDSTKARASRYLTSLLLAAGLSLNTPQVEAQVDQTVERYEQLDPQGTVLDMSVKRPVIKLEGVQVDSKNILIGYTHASPLYLLDILKLADEWRGLPGNQKAEKGAQIKKEVVRYFQENHGTLQTTKRLAQIVRDYVAKGYRNIVLEQDPAVMKESALVFQDFRDDVRKLTDVFSQIGIENPGQIAKDYMLVRWGILGVPDDAIWKQSNLSGFDDPVANRDGIKYFLTWQIAQLKAQMAFYKMSTTDRNKFADFNTQITNLIKRPLEQHPLKISPSEFATMTAGVSANTVQLMSEMVDAYNNVSENFAKRHQGISEEVRRLVRQGEGSIFIMGSDHVAPIAEDFKKEGKDPTPITFPEPPAILQDLSASSAIFSGTQMYHVVPLSEWNDRKNLEGGYLPARPGEFIHFSADIDTALAMANRFYKDATEPVMILKVDVAKASLGGEVRIDDGKEAYPHLYGPLPQNSVLEEIILNKNTQGSLVAAEEILNRERSASSAVVKNMGPGEGTAGKFLGVAQTAKTKKSGSDLYQIDAAASSSVRLAALFVGSVLCSGGCSTLQNTNYMNQLQDVISQENVESSRPVVNDNEMLALSLRLLNSPRVSLETKSEIEAGIQSLFKKKGYGILQTKKFDPVQPVVLMISGPERTTGAMKFIEILKAFYQDANLIAYQYDHSRSVEDVARDLSREWQEFQRNNNVADSRVILAVHSYGNVVLRQAVVENKKLFNQATVLAITPTYGGSQRAMGYGTIPGSKQILELIGARAISEAQNPQGEIQKRLFGNPDFVPPFAYVWNFLIEGDQHNPAKNLTGDEKVFQQHFEQGLKGGITVRLDDPAIFHGNAPSAKVISDYLRTLILEFSAVGQSASSGAIEPVYGIVLTDIGKASLTYLEAYFLGLIGAKFRAIPNKIMQIDARTLVRDPSSFGEKEQRALAKLNFYPVAGTEFEYRSSYTYRSLWDRYASLGWIQSPTTGVRASSSLIDRDQIMRLVREELWDLLRLKSKDSAETIGTQYLLTNLIYELALASQMNAQAITYYQSAETAALDRRILNIEDLRQVLTNATLTEQLGRVLNERKKIMRTERAERKFDEYLKVLENSAAPAQYWYRLDDNMKAMLQNVKRSFSVLHPAVFEYFLEISHYYHGGEQEARLGNALKEAYQTGKWDDEFVSYAQGQNIHTITIAMSFDPGKTTLQLGALRGAAFARPELVRSIINKADTLSEEEKRKVLAELDQLDIAQYFDKSGPVDIRELQGSVVSQLLELNAVLKERKNLPLALALWNIFPTIVASSAVKWDEGKPQKSNRYTDTLYDPWTVEVGNVNGQLITYIKPERGQSYILQGDQTSIDGVREPREVMMIISRMFHQRRMVFKNQLLVSEYRGFDPARGKHIVGHQLYRQNKTANVLSLTWKWAESLDSFKRHDTPKKIIARHDAQVRVASSSILLVDDSAVMLLGFKRALQNKGYDLHVAKNVEQARQVLALQTIDLVVTDGQMPLAQGEIIDDEAGVKLIAELNESHPEIPVILATATPELKQKVLAYANFQRGGFINKNDGPQAFFQVESIAQKIFNASSPLGRDLFATGTRATLEDIENKTRRLFERLMPETPFVDIPLTVKAAVYLIMSEAFESSRPANQDEKQLGWFKYLEVEGQQNERAVLLPGRYATSIAKAYDYFKSEMNSLGIKREVNKDFAVQVEAEMKKISESDVDAETRLELKLLGNEGIVYTLSRDFIDVVDAEASKVFLASSSILNQDEGIKVAASSAATGEGENFATLGLELKGQIFNVRIDGQIARMEAPQDYTGVADLLGLILFNMPELTIDQFRYVLVDNSLKDSILISLDRATLFVPGTDLKAIAQGLLDDTIGVELNSTKASSSLVAKDQKVGGIDFDPSKLNLQIKRDGRGVPLPLPQQNLENINIEGLFPVIINILPVNPRTLPVLGELDTTPDAVLSKS